VRSCALQRAVTPPMLTGQRQLYQRMHRPVRAQQRVRTGCRAAGSRPARSRWVARHATAASSSSPIRPAGRPGRHDRHPNPALWAGHRPGLASAAPAADEPHRLGRSCRPSAVVADRGVTYGCDDGGSVAGPGLVVDFASTVTWARTMPVLVSNGDSRCTWRPSSRRAPRSVLPSTAITVRYPGWPWLPAPFDLATASFRAHHCV
jgi:hypothetical protein